MTVLTPRGDELPDRPRGPAFLLGLSCAAHLAHRSPSSNNTNGVLSLGIWLINTLSCDPIPPMTHPTTNIAQAAENLRARCLASGMSRAKLARGALMHANSLRHLYQDRWDPSLSTMVRLEAFLNAENVPTAPARSGRPGASA